MVVMMMVVVVMMIDDDEINQFIVEKIRKPFSMVDRTINKSVNFHFHHTYADPVNLENLINWPVTPVQSSLKTISNFFHTILSSNKETNTRKCLVQQYRFNMSIKHLLTNTKFLYNAHAQLEPH